MGKWESTTIKTDTALTRDIIEKAMDWIDDNSGRPGVIYTSPKFIEDYKKWQKQENWLRSLPPHREKLERLKIKLKSAPKYREVNLPD
jgi:GH25 family lysozyme M1 (1,4-beta-N-acetylmuramidase)